MTQLKTVREDSLRTTLKDCGARCSMELDLLNGFDLLDLYRKIFASEVVLCSELPRSAYDLDGFTDPLGIINDAGQIEGHFVFNEASGRGTQVRMGRAG